MEKAASQAREMAEIRAEVRERLGVAVTRSSFALRGDDDPANRDAHYAEAVAQLRLAMAMGSTDAERRLVADMEAGTPLYTLANTPPYDAELLELLMNVSVA